MEKPPILHDIYIDGVKPRLGVDVDNVIVRTDLYWDNWLRKQACVKESRLPERDVDYRISNYYPEVTGAMDWWRSKDLYDELDPLPSAVKALNSLSRYFDIIFISTIKGNHHKSKWNFLKRNFPYMKGFLATKEKGLVDVDVMIEDRAVNLDLFADRVYKVLFETKYKQENPEHKYRPVSGWEEVTNRCLSYLELSSCLHAKNRRKAL